MKKVFLLLAVLVTFASCNQVEKREVHSYVTTDDVGILYWYLYYGDNNQVHYSTSRVPVSDMLDLAWNVADAIPSPVVGAKELPLQQVQVPAEEENEEADEADNDTDTDADTTSDSDSDSGSDSSGDSGGGDGGGGDGGGGD